MKSSVAKLVHRVPLEFELSCISIAQISREFDIIVVGTLKPSIEVLSFTSDKSPRAIAIGNLTVETSIFSSAPQDVRLVLGVGDRPYVLSGLKNGMLLRFEWPSASSLDEDFTLNLKLVCSRKLGSRPAFLVPLSPSPDANVIALGDRPYLVRTSAHMSCSSICFPPSTHATPICSAELPMAVIFIAYDRYHLVEIPHCNTKEETYKKFSLDPFSPSFQKFKIGGTPKKILYHSSNSLLLILRTNLNDVCSSDVCCMDPLSVSLLASFRFNQDETGNSMELVEIGAEHVLVVGTSSSNSVQGRVLVFRLEQMQTMERASTRYSSREQLNEACSLKLVCSETWEGRIEICGYLITILWLRVLQRTYYFYEFGNDVQHVALVAAVNSGKAYIAGSTAPQSKWNDDGLKLRSAAVSLTVL